MYIYCKKPHSLLPPHVGGKGAGGSDGGERGGRGEGGEESGPLYL